MKSIRELYIIGHGPSSSHTMGVGFACNFILEKYKNIKEITVILYGSLALTGKGHLTDYIIKETFKDYKVNILDELNSSVDNKTGKVSVRDNKDISSIRNT